MAAAMAGEDVRVNNRSSSKFVMLLNRCTLWPLSMGPGGTGLGTGTGAGTGMVIIGIVMDAATLPRGTGPVAKGGGKLCSNSN